MFLYFHRNSIIYTSCKYYQFYNKYLILGTYAMYFISNEDGPVGKSDIVPKSNTIKKSLSANDIKVQLNEISDENSNVGKRVYGRARANLSFSSFYIFCEDFRKQIDCIYAHENEAYRKNM